MKEMKGRAGGGGEQCEGIILLGKGCSGIWRGRVLVWGSRRKKQSGKRPGAGREADNTG